MEYLKSVNRKYAKYLPQCWFGICPAWGNINSLDSFIDKAQLAITGLSAFSAVVAIIMIIYGGYTFITSGGDAEKIDQGSKMLTNAVIGLLIVFAASSIIQFVIDRVFP